MSARERLDGYLSALKRRLRAQIYTRAAAVAAAGVLGLTCLAAWALAREQFSPSITLLGRSALAVFLLLVVALLLAWPLVRLRRHSGADELERKLPEQNGRIQTYLDGIRREREGVASVLLALLAADAMRVAEKAPPARVVPSYLFVLPLALAILCALVLGWLLVAGPGHWGYASRHLLFGMELPRDAVPVRTVVVKPGDATVRRNSDLALRASVRGFDPKRTEVLVRFEGQEQWERAPMQPAADGSPNEFEFRLYAVRAPLEYYVEADGTRSDAHNVSVVDLPRIERVRLTYEYPDWTGLPPRVDESSRDIRAVEGTRVRVEVFSDAPLEGPTLIVDGAPGELQQDGRVSVGTIAVTKPGHYHIGARVADELVALSEEYPIELVPDEKPVVEIVRPGRDWRATSIEEVPVRIRAEDDFRLRDVSLRYSVNGGEWQSLRITGPTKKADEESLLNLERLGELHAAGTGKRLVPGDIISYYAVARDRRSSVQTDLYLVQVQPFERRFTQAQAGSAGGGMSDEQGAISERQREILLATWNLQRNDERNARSPEQLEGSARMLAELQGTLAQQARTLALRTRARAMVEQDERIRTFVESLERAAQLMDPAAGHLNDYQLADAVPLEQQALQQLLRAESAFRDVQVSMQREGQPGSGLQSARNFTEMFELEMDLEKNQYESESSLSMRNTREELNEAIRKLKELAERQERLAQERRRELRVPEERWKQEQLRREVEDLRRRLAELDRQQSASGSRSASASRSGGNGQGEPSEQRSDQSDREQQERSRVARALEALNQAIEDMRAANGQAGSQGSDDSRAAETASRNLKRALRQFDQPEASGIDEALGQFAARAEQLLENQRKVENELYEALSRSGQTPRFGLHGGLDQEQVHRLVRSKQQLANDLSDLQRDMRSAVHEHRERAPESSRRLSGIIRDIEGSDVMYRLNRSAAEIYYGRAREAAPREGLITEAFDALGRSLREAQARAAKEGGGRQDEVTPQELLAEVAQLRRALEEARRAGAQPGERVAQAGGERGEQQDGTEAAGTTGVQRGQPRSAQRGRGGLADWDPISPAVPGEVDSLGHSLAPQTAELSERIRNLTYRMRRGSLTQSELEALRRTATELRRRSGDPMAGRGETLLGLIEQIELTALAASARESPSAQAASGIPESARYREAVAEYYRRLGDQ